MRPVGHRYVLDRPDARRPHPIRRDRETDAKRKWCAREPTGKKPVITVIVAAGVIIAAFAWRDLGGATRSGSSEEALVGVAMIADPVNSLASWALGRR